MRHACCIPNAYALYECSQTTALAHLRFAVQRQRGLRNYVPSLLIIKFVLRLLTCFQCTQNFSFVSLTQILLLLLITRSQNDLSKKSHQTFTWLEIYSELSFIKVKAIPEPISRSLNLLLMIKHHSNQKIMITY